MDSGDRFLKFKIRQQSQIQKPLKHFTSFLDAPLPAHGAEVAHFRSNWRYLPQLLTLLFYQQMSGSRLKEEETKIY